MWNRTMHHLIQQLTEQNDVFTECALAERMGSARLGTFYERMLQACWAAWVWGMGLADFPVLGKLEATHDLFQVAEDLLKASMGCTHTQNAIS